MIEKICFVFLSAMIVAVLARPGSIGGFNITRDNETLICDRLTCPEKTELCVIKSKTDEKRENITTVWQCVGENNEVLLEEKSTEENPDPDNDVDMHLESGNKTSPEMQKYIDDISENIAKHLESIKNQFKNFWNDPFGNFFF